MELLPRQLTEATDGVILVLVAFSIWFVLVHLWRRWGQRAGVHHFYYANKAAIAFLAVLCGFEMRLSLVWWVRHELNAGREVGPLLSGGAGFAPLVAAPAIYFTGTVLVVVGALCWVRVMSPSPCGALGYWLMAAAALAFGVGMAL